MDYVELKTEIKGNFNVQLGEFLEEVYEMISENN